MAWYKSIKKIQLYFNSNLQNQDEKYNIDKSYFPFISRIETMISVGVNQFKEWLTEDWQPDPLSKV